MKKGKKTNKELLFEGTLPDDANTQMSDAIVRVLRSDNADSARMSKCSWYFSQNMEQYGMNSLLRIAMFWSQTAYETEGFTYFEELGDPDYFSQYDFREDLGNSQKGDGYLFKGRGLAMLTGRYNYQEIGTNLKVDLIDNPLLVKEDPNIAVLSALEYFKIRNINAFADKGDIGRATRAINGGLNGFQGRLANYDTALTIGKQVLDQYTKENKNE